MGITRAQAFPSNYLGKEDVSSPRIVTIKSVFQDDIDDEGKKVKKAIIEFAEPDVKPFILNNTNWITIEEAYGLDSDMWRGKKVEVFIDPNVMYGGKKVGGVRVRIPSAGAATQSFESFDAPAPLWSFDQCVIEAAKVAISKDDLIKAMKHAGHQGFNPVTGPAFVRALIEQQKSQAGRDLSMDEIPFNHLSAPCGV